MWTKVSQCPGVKCHFIKPVVLFYNQIQKLIVMTRNFCEMRILLKCFVIIVSVK